MIADWIRDKKGSVSYLGIFIAFLITLWLFLKVINFYFKKPAASNERVTNIFTGNDQAPPRVTAGNYDSVLDSVKQQLNASVAKELSRTNDQP